VAELASPPSISPACRVGSQTALRNQNVRRVVDTLIANGASTRAEIARHTGLSAATVSNIVAVMVDHGTVSTSPTRSSGRRAVHIRLESRGAVIVGIDVGRRHARVVLASLAHQVLGERAITLPRGHRREEGIEAAARLLEEVLESEAVERRAVVGVGVGVPGPIDRRTGSVVDGGILPEWAGVDLVAAFGQRLGLPVFVDNDANLGALAEVTWGAHAMSQNLVFLKLGSGIGCGLVIGGEPFYGHLGIAGEIGHSPVSDLGPMCHCGNRGCLETVASTSMMIDVLGKRSNPSMTTDDIVRQAIAGDVATLRVVGDAGFAAGRAVAGVVNLLNPEVVVIGGPLAVLGDILLDPVRRGFERYAVPLAAETTTIAVSSLGDRAEVLGATSLVARQPSLQLA
jgi:predicted NBD/HSP70 family sugar kinase